MRILLPALLAFSMTSALSGCQSTLAASPTVSRMGTVSGNTVQASLSQETNRHVTRGTVGTAAYVVGIDSNRGQFAAIAGYRNANVGSAVTGGTASYTTNYTVTAVDAISRSNTMISGYSNNASGTMQMSADFDAGTLRGSNAILNVDGDINGTALSGRVVVSHLVGASRFATRDLATTLQGEIGADGLIGVFHGADADTVIAGGMVGTRN